MIAIGKPMATGMLILLMGVGWTAAQDDKDRQKEEKDAARYYDKWLNEDVVYLISDEERGVFESLTTSEEKDRFIEQFWASRDTDLTTAINEFREEHYRRIAHANRTYGSGIPGWKTDRGRIYIMYGPADQVEYNAGGGTYVRPSYEGGGRTATYPFELWRYNSIPGLGEDIEIEFVDRSWSGEFKLVMYPWEKDMLLHVDGLGETQAERLGMAKRNERPGLHPGNLNNLSYMRRNMGTRIKDQPYERMRQFFDLQRPPQIQQKELETIVNSKISYQQLPMSIMLNYLWLDPESALVPITLEIPNSSLTYINRGAVHKARVAIYGRVTSMLGQIDAEFEDVVASEYRPEYLEAGMKQKSLYQKTVMLKKGRYKVDVVVKDLNSGNLASYADSVHLSGVPTDQMAPGTIVLAKQLEVLADFPDKPESFVLGDVRVVPNVSRQFRNKDALGIYLQFYRPVLDESSQEPAISVEYTIARGDKVISSVTDSEGASIEYVSEERLVLVQSLSIEDLERGKYRLTIRVKDSITGANSTMSEDFEVIDG